MRSAIALATAIALSTGALAAPAAAQSSWKNNWNNSGWNNGGGQIIRCESWNYHYARCNADTRDGVRLSRVIAGDCSRRNWGSSRNFVWVDRGCRAEFELGRRGGGGASTGAVIAGAAVAAGLLALLLSKGKKKEAETSTQGNTDTKPPATIDIAPNQVPTAAEAAFRQCIDEAARQIGATGGTRLRLTGEVQHRTQGTGWEFRLPLEGTWDGKPQPAPAECAATDTAVQKLDFLPEPASN